MNDNHASALPTLVDKERARNDSIKLIAEKFAEHRERMKVTPLARMPSDYWDRRRALKDKRTGIE